METRPSTVGDESALVAEILADAKKKANRLRRRAQREAEKLRQDVQRSAANSTASLEKDAEDRAERAGARVLRAVEQEIKRKQLSAHEAVLESLFEQARQQLLDRASYDVRRSLVELAVAAVSAMRGSEFNLCVAAQDASLIDDAFLAEVSAAVAATDGRVVTLQAVADGEDISGGVIVRSKDGHQVFDNSFDARMARLKPVLRHTLAAMVFHNDGPAGNAESGGGGSADG